jgi:CP family cyanate transporter-like MFS transporter
MTETRRAETAWLAVLAATACGVVVAMNIGKLPIALPLLRGEFGLSLTAAGWLAAAFSTLAMVSGAAIGIVADRLGALRFCLFGLAASTVGGLMGLTGTSENQLLISRIVEGVGFLAVAVSAPALVSAASAPAHIRLTLGIWSCYMPAGASLCVLLAPLFLERGGWRGLWWLVLLLLLAAFLTLILQRRHFDSAAAGRHQGLTEVRGALLQPVPWLLTLAFAAYALQFFAVVIWLPTFLQEQRDMPDALIALLSALVIAAQRAWQPGGRRLAASPCQPRPVDRRRLAGHGTGRAGNISSRCAGQPALPLLPCADRRGRRHPGRRAVLFRGAGREPATDRNAPGAICPGLQPRPVRRHPPDRRRSGRQRTMAVGADGDGAGRAVRIVLGLRGP